jgi:UPF0755 protein
MQKKHSIIAICFLFLLCALVLVSSSHIRNRIRAHIDAWQGKVKVAQTIIVTFPEGMTNIEMSALLAAKIPHFDKNVFLKKVNDLQGSLFPDTYFFTQSSTVDKIISELSLNFHKKVDPLKEEIHKSGYSLSDIIVMASLVEAEAHGKNDAPIISGILWKRISEKMPLQVDADPETYKTVGLPKNPINNPGLISIEAALAPTETPYFFYLHDKEGTIHLAKTFAEHKKNIAKYLR